MKKIAVGIMAAMIAVSVLAITKEVYAADVPSSWAYETVSQAVEINLVPENLQSNFAVATTRAEFAALAVVLYESRRGTISGQIAFEDTSDIAVSKAAYVGLVNGVGNDMFNPDGTLTREQAAVLISRLASALSNPLPIVSATFADNENIAYWALESVGQVQAAAIMGGVGENRFDPCGSFTREQSIVTMMRLYNLITADARLVGSWYWNGSRDWKYHFYEDGTGVRGLANDFVEFEWTVTGDMLAMSRFSNVFMSPEIWHFTIVGSSLRLESPFGDYVFYYTHTNVTGEIYPELIGVWYWNHGV